MEAALYLIPTALSDAALSRVLPSYNFEIVRGLRCFIVENLRAARRFLRRLDPAFPIDDCEFQELNTRTDRDGLSTWLEPLRHGEAMGLLSDAGCPAVADPGSDVVALAQREGMKVVPLVGPSSILLALMASGFNGQGFAFNGYLPVEDSARGIKVGELERIARRTGQTQIFIETPYRNNSLLRFLCDHLNGETLLCVASDVTDPDKESIVTRPVKEWRRTNRTYDKHPAIFLLHVASADPGPKRKGGRG